MDSALFMECEENCNCHESLEELMPLEEPVSPPSCPSANGFSSPHPWRSNVSPVCHYLESVRWYIMRALDCEELKRAPEMANVAEANRRQRRRQRIDRRMKVAYTGAHLLAHVTDNYDRPADVYIEGPYAGTDTYAYAFNNKPGQRIPKAGAVAEAGVVRAGVECSIFEAEINGPNASAGAEANALEAVAMAQAEVASASASVGPFGVKAKGPNASAEAEVSWLGAGAMARAEVASVSAAAGPFGVKYGLAVDTGVKLSFTEGEVKILGTGVTVGRTTGVSVLGNEMTFTLW
ncbi:hypothetical protein MHYP_G00167850 [Metynnis hypsauchen]